MDRSSMLMVGGWPYCNFASGNEGAISCPRTGGTNNDNKYL